MPCYIMIKMDDWDAQRKVYEELLADAQIAGVDIDEYEQIMWDPRKNNIPLLQPVYVLWLSDSPQKWKFPSKAVFFFMSRETSPPGQKVEVRSLTAFANSVAYIHEDRIEGARTFFEKLVVAI